MRGKTYTKELKEEILRKAKGVGNECFASINLNNSKYREHK
ncbi:hypothetical protein [Candidatus Clostridium stratigraminis]|uniref:Transposase n=1 Tax=Candidatus Clostridium stratigraminis TaxID=3381661 RepID=A0ABW8T6N7_9CLOT